MSLCPHLAQGPIMGPVQAPLLQRVEYVELRGDFGAPLMNTRQKWAEGFLRSIGFSATFNRQTLQKVAGVFTGVFALTQPKRFLVGSRHFILF